MLIQLINIAECLSLLSKTAVYKAQQETSVVDYGPTIPEHWIIDIAIQKFLYMNCAQNGFVGLLLWLSH